MFTNKQPLGGAEIAARMTPEARSERARRAANARHGANNPQEAAMNLTLGSTIITQKLADGRWQAQLSRQRLYAFGSGRNEAVAAVIQKGRESAADQWQAAVRYVELPKESPDSEMAQIRAAAAPFTQP